ncbi:MAG: Holliday junction branch migration protein RuvA [Bacteroidetes bacterium]|nr:Holliday junction branch migration protein RuvA [Fibrella sp.]
MIAYIDGTLAYKEATYVIIDVGGLGYELHISLQTYSTLPAGGVKCKLFTYQHIREDIQALYGFATADEKYLFLDLLSVSGIGPNSALVMLSSMTSLELRQAIVSENVRTVQSIKGIGPKTAQRVILELKDKMKKQGLVASDTPSYRQGIDPVREEALAALVALGLARPAAEKNLDTIIRQSDGNLTVEDLIRQSLR